MTDNDNITLLREAVERYGSQAKVGKVIGYSAGAISQVLSNTYTASLETFLGRVEECFGKEIVACPLLGEIPFHKCVRERRRPFSSGNPFRVRLYRQCGICEFNTDRTTL